MTRSRLLKNIINGLPWALACFFVAGIVHIVSVLLTPDLADGDAYSIFSRAVRPKEGVMTLVGDGASDAPSIGGIKAYHDPAAILASCLYNLPQGPTRVQAQVSGDIFFSLSFHDRNGRVFYATTDRAALRRKIDIILVDAQQLDTLEANDPEDQPPQDLRLLSPTPLGFVLARAYAQRPGQEAQIEQFLKSIICKIEKS